MVDSGKKPDPKRADHPLAQYNSLELPVWTTLLGIVVCVLVVVLFIWSPSGGSNATEPLSSAPAETVVVETTVAPEPNTETTAPPVQEQPVDVVQMQNVQGGFIEVETGAATALFQGFDRLAKEGDEVFPLPPGYTASPEATATGIEIVAVGDDRVVARAALIPGADPTEAVTVEGAAAQDVSGRWEFLFPANP